MAAVASRMAIAAPVAPATFGRSLRTQPAPAARPVAAQAAAGNWLPGKAAPEHLQKADLPGNFGFDPWNLGTNPAALKWYQQAELQNGRWAMAGTAGALAAELTGHSFWDAGSGEYWAPNGTLFAIEFFLMAWVEARRLQDYNKPGSANQDPIFSGNKLPDGNEPGYPGGIFDPLGWSKGDMATLKLKEIKNARLAMLAYAGLIAQHITTGKGPIENLKDHLADPWTNNVITNELARVGASGSKAYFSFIN